MYIDVEVLEEYWTLGFVHSKFFDIPVESITLMSLVPDDGGVSICRTSEIASFVYGKYFNYFHASISGIK